MPKYLKEVFDPDIVSNIPNALIEASYRFNLNGERIKYLIFSKLNQFDFLQDPPIMVRVKVDEYAFYFGNTSSNALKLLRSGAQSIVESPVLFKNCTDRIPLIDKYSVTLEDGLVMIINQEFLLKCSGAEALFNGILF